MHFVIACLSNVDKIMFKIKPNASVFMCAIIDQITKVKLHNLEVVLTHIKHNTGIFHS